MENIVLGLKKDNMKFSIKIRPFEKFNRALFELRKDDFTAHIDFSSPKNYYARVYYKDFVFSGTILSRNEWRIWNKNFDNILMKRGNKFYFKMVNSFTDESRKSVEFNTRKTDYLKSNIFKNIYDDLLVKYYSLFTKIENKEHFLELLKEYLLDNGDFEFDDNEEIIGYRISEYDDGETNRDKLINECQEFFERYLKSEKDENDLKNIVTMKELVKIAPELEQINKVELEIIFNKWIADNLVDYDLKDIYYDRGDLLYTIGCELISIYNHSKRKEFEDNFENHMISLLGIKLENIKDTYSLSRQILNEFKDDEIPSDKLIIETADKYINATISFYARQKSIIDNFGSNEIIIELDDILIAKFKGYEKGANDLNDNDIKLYELVYKPVVDDYKMYCCKKNTIKPKPIIEGFNSFVKYVMDVFEILIENRYLMIENEITEVIALDQDNINKIIKKISNINIL